MQTIENRVLKTELIRWKELEPFQGELKTISRGVFEKLKQSIRNNHFVEPLNVWQNGKFWCLDGHSRLKALSELEKEGVVIPDLLPANFIDCKNKREAKKLVLVYSSIYARASMETLDEFIKSSDLDFDELKLEIDLPEMSFADPIVVLGDSDIVEKDQRAGSSPWSRVEPSGLLRCIIGDIEFGIDANTSVAFQNKINALAQEQSITIRDCARQWLTKLMQ